MKVYLVESVDYGSSHSERLEGIGVTLEVAKKICYNSIDDTNIELFETREDAIEALKDYSLDFAYIYKPYDTCYYQYSVENDIINEHYDGEIRISEYIVEE